MTWTLEPSPHPSRGGKTAGESTGVVGSMIYAIEVPPAGGDTLFANMSLAYETLSDGMKAMLSRLEAVHSSRHVFGPGHKANPDLSDRFRNAEQAVQDAVHPVVIRHPETARKVLYVNPTFTVRFDGWTEEESRPLLDYLYTHAARPEFSCRVQWMKGSLGLWDNRATWHLALNDYHGHRRLMHRVTIGGRRCRLERAPRRGSGATRFEGTRQQPQLPAHRYAPISSCGDIMHTKLISHRGDTSCHGPSSACRTRTRYGSTDRRGRNGCP